MRIKFTDVTHVYTALSGKNTEAIKNVTLDLSGQQLTAIVGHTGSGKSTAMQHINGLLQPTTGNVEVDTITITNKKIRDIALIRKHIGYVFQNPAYQLFASSILEDVAYGPKNFGMSEQEATAAAQKALEIVDVPKELWDAYPFDLSGGQMRKVAIAGAISYNPDVLILDEPTVGLDPLITQQFFEILRKLHDEEHKSLIFITHDMEFVYQIAGRVIVFFEGQVVFDGAPFELFSQIDLLEKYALAMPELFEIAHKLRAAGLDIDVRSQDFSYETIETAVRLWKERG